MQKYFRFLLVIILTIMTINVQGFGQTNVPVFKTMQIFKDGIGVAITADSFSLKWGVQLEKLEESAQSGVKAAGWEFNQGSNIIINISIDSLLKRDDSTYAFRIEVNRIRRNIDMKKNETELLSSTIYQSVYSFANRLRREIIREVMASPDPDYIPSIEKSLWPDINIGVNDR